MISETGGYSPDRQAENELSSFIENISTPDTESLMPKVRAKIGRAGSPEAVMDEIKRLDKELAGVDDEEERAGILKDYLGDGEDDAEDDTLRDGFGDDEQV